MMLTRTSTLDRNWLKEQVMLLLSPKRYIHSVAVAELAERWAANYHVDTERAYLSGLLHDVARDMTNEQLLAAAKRYRIPVDQVILGNPLILHAQVGACFVREEWQVDDPLVLEAMTRHTIPETDMSDLAKLIYLADICEPNRRWWPGREILTRLAQQDLDEAMTFGLSETMDYLQEKGEIPHPHTLQVLEHFRNKAASQARRAQ